MTVGLSWTDSVHNGRYFWRGGFQLAGVGTSDGVVLLASWSEDLQLSLERFVAECEMVEMRIGTSKTETRVLSWKIVNCPGCLRVGNEVLKRRSFSITWSLFMSGGRMENGGRSDNETDFSLSLPL